MANRPVPRPNNAASSQVRKIPCRSPGCNRWFCNNAGLTKHMRTKHAFVQPHERPIPHPSWELNDFPDFDGALDEGHAPEDGQGELREWEHHPLLCGVYHLLSAQPTFSVCLFRSDAM